MTSLRILMVLAALLAARIDALAQERPDAVSARN
jgi:hypothetical protein